MESSINQPHPSAPADDAEEFFGTPGTLDDPGEFEPSGNEPSGQTETEPPWEPDPAEQAAASEEPEQSPPAPQQPQAAQQQSKTATREYLVFHRLALTEKVLKHLLQELESQERGGQPRFAFFELHRAEARNPGDAIGDAYDRYRERIGDAVDVVATTSTAFQVRHVEPRQERVKTKLQIT